MAVIANFTTVRPEMAHSRTYKDFYNFIGQHANNFGVVARLYNKHTMSYFTEAFGNVITGNEGSRSKFQPVDTMKFEWEVETNEIKRIPFACSVSATYGTTHGIDIPMAFTERYYEVNDTFMIDGSHQLCYVVDGPVRKADRMWEYNVRLVDSSYNAELLVEYCKEGMTTRWISNIQPEYHEQGYTKYTSNFEKMIGWIGEIRCDIDASSRYLAMEDSFVKVIDEGVGNSKSHVFKMPGMKKVLLDNFMDARNNGMIWNKTTMDANGKCVLHDRQGRDLICGDGVVAQISRYCGKTNYAGRLSVNILTQVIGDLADKCEESMGNHFAFVVNDILMKDLQGACADFLFKHHVNEQYLYSKFEQDKIKVGATYGAFEWMGNTISFKLDRALTNEYPSQGYGILVDLTADSVSGMAPIQALTLKGKQMIQNQLTGVGVKDGEVATAVAGQKMMISGYSGIAVLNPYRSHILVQNV